MAAGGGESDRGDDAEGPILIGRTDRDLAVFAGRVVRIVAAGVVCGAVVGGGLGRVAMFVLRLTSDDAVRGLTTDDGFQVGSFDIGDTLGLLVFTAVLGGACATVYAGFRWWIPRALRVGASAVVFGGFGGSMILEPGELDFVVLEPELLAVAMFIAIPALFGAALAWTAERVERPGEPLRWWQVLVAAPVVLFAPFVIVAIAVTALVRAAAQNPRVAELARTPQAILVARVGLGAVAAAMLAATIDDARRII